MTNGPVLYRRNGRIVTITLNWPEPLDAMNEPMMREIERMDRCILRTQRLATASDRTAQNRRISDTHATHTRWPGLDSVRCLV
jgi:hypothetical protein